MDAWAVQWDSLPSSTSVLHVEVYGAPTTTLSQYYVKAGPYLFQSTDPVVGPECPDNNNVSSRDQRPMKVAVEFSS